jgi:hypothetical protein
MTMSSVETELDDTGSRALGARDLFTYATADGALLPFHRIQPLYERICAIVSACSGCSSFWWP